MELDRLSGTAAPKTVTLPVGKLVPLLLDAAKNKRAWLSDFAEDNVRIDADLYDVLLAYQTRKCTSGLPNPRSTGADQTKHPPPYSKRRILAMRSIAVINQKGGVGKTTSSVNLSAALAESGRRVCLMDLDPQAHASLHLGITAVDDEASMYEVLCGDATIDQARRKVNDHSVCRAIQSGFGRRRTGTWPVKWAAR